MPCRGGVSQWIVNMVNVFGRNGGFKAIRDELMLADQPLCKTRALLRLIFEVKDVLTEEFLNWFAVILAPIFEQVMSHIARQYARMQFMHAHAPQGFSAVLRFSISAANHAGAAHTGRRDENGLQGRECMCLSSASAAHRIAPGGPLPVERASCLGMHFLLQLPHSLTPSLPPSLTHSRLLTPSTCLSSLPASLSRRCPTTRLLSTKYLHERTPKR
jgi:hypothetical protein